MPDHAISKSVPRYITVAQTLMSEIEHGKYPVGGLLPTETDICDRFGISRYTAREAVRQLSNVGMVTRRAGVGTTIKSKSVNARYVATVSDPSDLFAFAKQTRAQILSEDKVRIAGEWEKLVPSASGELWLRFISLRYSAHMEAPLAYVETLVHPAYESIKDRVHKPGQLIFKLIEEARGEKIHTLKQEIDCVALTKKIAGLVQASIGSPALRVVRSYLAADDSLLSISVNTHPQDRFKLVSRWDLNWGSEEV